MNEQLMKLIIDSNFMSHPRGLSACAWKSIYCIITLHYVCIIAQETQDASECNLDKTIKMFILNQTGTKHKTENIIKFRRGQSIWFHIPALHKQSPSPQQAK